MLLTEDEVQQIIQDARLRGPYDVARAVEAVVLDKLKDAAKGGESGGASEPA